MGKRLLAGLLLIALFLGTMTLWLPAVVSQTVAQGMKGILHSEQAAAQVTKEPAFLMLKGQFDSVQIQARDARMDKVAFSEIQARLEGLQLDVGDLLKRRAVVIRSLSKASITAALSEAELARHLNQAVKGVRGATVKVSKGKVEVAGSFSLGSLARMTVALEGKVVADRDTIKFVTEKFLLNNASLGNIGGSVLTEIPIMNSKAFPFGVTVREVVMEEGRVLVYADNEAK
ncbi:DUF2993 domain-containing protein [Acetonema longum]|uniref:DUF2993 domain-containing protein n=1 Tax=Acetonema longum DSM 6540 TaxID=1009370 RepID=F7NNX7_9FIRM|nr:DUF2993 domain-containing protein [Acetonema longum]EGO62311.1 hypothetical protein ALO_19092 [Acetonema longum DSM 6540]